MTACNTLVAQQAVYEYCCIKREVRLKDRELNMTCSELVEQEFVSGRIQGLDCKNVGC